MKKLIVAFMLLLPTFIAGCSKDDDVDGNGAKAGTVKIDSKSFTPKYGYILPYDNSDKEYDVLCSDVDMTDAFKGKAFKKKVSYVAFICIENSNSNELELDSSYGVYKCTVDTKNETFVPDNDSMIFDWESDYSSYNPSGSSYSARKSGSTYSFDGENLLADAWLEDEDGHDEVDLGYVNFSFSIDIKPKRMELDTRSMQMKIITDPSEAKILRNLLKSGRMNK